MRATDGGTGALCTAVIARRTTTHSVDRTSDMLSTVSKFRNDISCRGLRDTHLLSSSRCALGDTLKCISLGFGLRPSRILTITFRCACGKVAFRINRFSSSLASGARTLFIGALGGASGAPRVKG